MLNNSSNVSEIISSGSKIRVGSYLFASANNTAEQNSLETFNGSMSNPYTGLSFFGIFDQNNYNAEIQTNCSDANLTCSVYSQSRYDSATSLLTRGMFPTTNKSIQPFSAQYENEFKYLPVPDRYDYIFNEYFYTFHAAEPAYKDYLPVNNPKGIAVSKAGNLIAFADTGNNIVGVIDLANNTNFRWAGNGGNGYITPSSDALDAEIYHPQALAYSQNGDLYIASEEGY